MTITVTKDGRLQHNSLQIYVELTLQMNIFLTALTSTALAPPLPCPVPSPTPPKPVQQTQSSA